MSKNPERAELIKFREAEFPFDRVHIDFLGPFHGKTFLLLIDAYSRWPEVIKMKHTDSESTIEVLREIFARFGIPKVLISDNGRQLVSEEFEKFCKLNGILHKTLAPYHPATNRLAENAVGSFKMGISKALHNQRGKCFRPKLQKSYEAFLVPGPCQRSSWRQDLFVHSRQFRFIHCLETTHRPNY